MDCQLENQHIVVNCGRHLDTESIQHQQEVLIQALATKKPIIFRANEVSVANTAAMQLLLGFTLAASRQNVRWEWEEPSASLVHVASLLGMRELLKLPEK